MNNTKHKPLCRSTNPKERHKYSFLATRISAGNVSPPPDRLCGLVVRVSGYRYRGPGFDPRRYQIL